MSVSAPCFSFFRKQKLTMHFLLGFLLGYYTRNKPLLAATLLGFALVCFIVLPAIALSGLALSVRRERLSRPPQTRVPQLVGLDYKTAETTLHNSKLNIRVLAHRYDPPVEPGKILFQTPQAFLCTSSMHSVTIKLRRSWSLRR